MRAYVEPVLSNGCGPRVHTCPEAFELSDENVDVVKVDKVPGELHSAYREAAQDCPGEATAIDERLGLNCGRCHLLEYFR
jgi:ferredoxin